VNEENLDVNVDDILNSKEDEQTIKQRRIKALYITAVAALVFGFLNFSKTPYNK